MGVSKRSFRMYLIIFSFYLISFLGLSQSNEISVNDVDVLIKNLFDNLAVDPYLQDMENIEESEAYVNKQVEHFLHFFKAFGKERGKRSLHLESLDNLIEDKKGVYKMNELEPFKTIPAKFPRDIEIFEHNKIWYAAVLESNGPDDVVTSLTIYAYKGENFEKTASVPTSGVDLAIHAGGNVALIVIAKNSDSKEFREKSAIFQYDYGTKLKWIQNITESHATDAAFWNYGRNLYLLMAQSQPRTKNASELNTKNLKTTIYKWAGTYFDIIQYLETKYAQRVVPFSIKSNQYLAIANFQDDKGDTNTYSDIYKFNVQSERFCLHQKIFTKACTDIRFFSFTDEENRLHEDFLVVANSFEEGPKGEKIFTTDSIIYKFIDGHFIPFQSIKLSGLEQWLPVKGPNGEFALFAFCKFDGMKVFQYDGWTFVETSFEYTSDIFKNNVKSIKINIFNDNIILAIANGNNDGGDTNIFKLDFTHENKLNQFYVEMLSWCKNVSKRLDDLEAWEKNISNHLNHIENMPQKLTKKPPERRDPGQQIRQAEAKTQENISSFKSDPQKILSMVNNLSSYQSLLDSVESSLKQPPEPTKLNVLSKNLSAEKIIISDEALVHLFNTDTINSINITDLIDNTIDITQGLTTNGSIEFEELRLAKLTSNPKSVNGHPLEDLLLTRDLKAFSIAIVGNATIGKNLYVNGDINNMKFDENHILLRTKNQEFEKTNVKGQITIDNLETSTLNNFELKNETCKNIENLKTKNLFIDDGYINGISFKKLDKHVLRTSGDQNMKATLNFENLQADKISITNLLNEAYMPSDLINTEQGEWNILGNLNFANDVTIRNLTVKKMLNNINVVNNKLDILLKKSPEKQHITGMKYFENLTLMNPVFLNGAFIEPGKPKINPVLDIYDDVIISKNLTIDGTVTIEKILKAFDIVTNDGQYSINKLTENGLRLNENKIPIELSFSQQPNIAEIFADRINGVDPGTWIVNGGKENQKIVGFKTFLGDLSISGSTTVGKVNNIDVKQLEQNVLTVDDDQEITGKHFVKHVITNSLTINQTLYGGEKLKDLIHNSDENQIFLKHLKAKSCSCQNLTVNGLTNGLNFTQIVDDTITNEKDIRSIEGHKTFRNLKCENLTTKNQSPDDIFLDPDNVPDEVIIDSNIDLRRPIVVHNINFTGKFNGVEDNEIDNVKNQQITLGQQSFKKITVFGQTHITSNSINGINIGSLANDTVKIGEDLELESLTVAGSVKVQNISLGGQIQGLDLENAVAPNSQQEQIILDEKVFSNDVVIRGDVSFEGLINGMEKTRFLNSLYPDPAKGKIIVKGNVTFAKGPMVDSLNDYTVEDLGKRVWFKDRSTVINGEMNFGDIVFMDDISIKGAVDEVDLPLLDKTYFSKTKNQTVAGIIEFADVTFDQTVTTPHVDLHGRINEIKLDEFERTVLLDDVDQIFEDLVSLENCQTEEAKGDYKVNDLDLEDDVMRYDRVNIVTGKKNIRFLNTNRLKIQKDIKVQNVKILETLENTVLRNMPVNIKGKKTFTDRVSFYKNLSVQGGVNGRPFNSETVMLKDVPQIVTGKKTLLSNKTDPTEFKSMKLKGFINDLSLHDVIKTQANKNEDNIFETPVNFHKDLTVNNLNIGKSYNGVNVTKLLSDVVTLNALTNYEDIYSNLLEKARRLYHSLQNQAYYLHYYKVVGNFKNVEVIPFTYNNKVDSLITFKNESGTTSVNFYEWDGAYNMYNAISFNMSMDYYPTYITKIKVYKKDCLYMEYPLTEVTNEDFSYHGTMYHVNKYDGHRKFLNYSGILSKKVKSLSVMTLPGSQEICLVCVYDQSDNVNILCDIGGNDFQIHQTFQSFGVSKVTTVTTDGIPHIITINHQSQSQLTESTVNIWKFSLENRLFHPHQTIHDKSPIHVDTIYHDRQYYLAIASGYLEKAVHAGSVYIRRFDKTSGFFEPYQILNLEAPIEVKFAVLPSTELVLYATTRNPSKPFIVYMYEGISGFVQKIVASAIEKAGFIEHFTNQANQHFILTGNKEEVNVIQAVFKGKKWTF